MKASPKSRSQPNKSQSISGKAGPVEITYYTDPLCCWSWGFEPQWRKLLYEFHGSIRWRYCMGGLLPSWKDYHDAVNIVSRPIQMGPVWKEASHITGMPVNDRIWRDNPPASSYPACIAVKCAMLQSVQFGEAYLRRLREAVMLEGQNISDLTVLIAVAETLIDTRFSEVDLSRFQEDLKNENGLEAFRADIQEITRHGIPRFPSLLIRGQGPAVLITGYRPYDMLLEAVVKVSPDAKPVRHCTDAETYNRYWGSAMPREIHEALT